MSVRGTWDVGTIQLQRGGRVRVRPEADAAVGKFNLYINEPDGNFVTYDFNDLDQIVLAYACTVHKSQGSEYGHVALVLPPSPHLELLDRRLVYTALTRARDSFELWCDEAVLRAALARRSGRVGGLRDKLMAQLVISAMRRTAPPKDPVE